jgi:hypothetical protein
VVDLADFAGRRLLLRWRFAADDTPGLDWGWWVDGIRLFVERECQACVPPDPPQWLQDEVGDGGVELSWPGVPFVESYQIHRSTVLARPFEHIATVAAPSETYRDTDVSGGTTYHYVVKSVDDCVSDESMLATATATGPCTLAPDFWGLDEVIDRREPGCALDLVWRPAEPGCAGGDPRYNIYRSMEAGFEPGPETRIAEDVAGSRYRDLGIGDREAVFYRVRAVDGISGAEEANPVVHGAATTGPDELLFSDSVEQGSDGWWTAVGSGADTGTEAWRVVDDRAFDGERSWFCANEPQIKDQVVGLLEPLTIDEPATVLAFHHLFDLEPFWDGGRLEYSTDGGSSWHDILSGDGASVGDNPNRFLRGGYSGFVSAGTGHPFGGEPAWTGWVDGWLETIVDLDDFVGLTVAFRWRLGCDRSDARVGWWLDDLLLVQTTACTPVVSPGPRPTGVRRP